MDSFDNSTFDQDEIDFIMLSWDRTRVESCLSTSSKVYGLCPIEIIRGKIHIVSKDTAVDIMGEQFCVARNGNRFVVMKMVVFQVFFMLIGSIMKKCLQYEQNYSSNEKFPV